MNPKDRIIFALDVPNIIVAESYVKLLEHHVGLFKVGLELFMAAGPAAMRPAQMRLALGRTMLDMKLHDIPETVEHAVQRAGDLGARFLTLHVQQRETMKRAVRAAEKTGMQLLAVTVLTSITQADCKELELRSVTGEVLQPSNVVSRYATLAWDCGINGFVCSPQEVKMLRYRYPEANLVVPGIRPTGAATGDQKRTGTPKQAVADGADYLVVGRPIRDAADPVAAVEAIVQEIST